MMEIQDCLILTLVGNQPLVLEHMKRGGKWYFEVWIKAEVNNVNIGIGTQGDVNFSGQHYHGYRSENGNISAASGTNDGSWCNLYYW